MNPQAMRVPAAVRATRGGLLAIVAASLAVAAHAVGGGGFPDAGPTLLVTALLGWVCTALADCRRGTASVIGALAMSQVALHLILALSPTHSHRGAVDGHGSTAPAGSAGEDMRHEAAEAVGGGTDDTARWMAGAALLVGALGLGVGGGAIARSRRRGAPASGSGETTQP